METLGGHYAWLGIGLALAILGGCVVLLSIIVIASVDQKFTWLIATLIAAGACASGVVVIVQQNWEISRITCTRVARNFDTDHRWTKALGCYLQDDSGRYIPEYAYITTRVERGEP